MKHEETIILYSCDNISFFSMQTQIFISCGEKNIQYYQWQQKIDQNDFKEKEKKDNTISNNSTQSDYGGSIMVGCFLLLVIRSWQNNY